MPRLLVVAALALLSCTAEPPVISAAAPTSTAPPSTTSTATTQSPATTAPVVTEPVFPATCSTAIYEFGYTEGFHEGASAYSHIQFAEPEGHDDEIQQAFTSAFRTYQQRLAADGAADLDPYVRDAVLDAMTELSGSLIDHYTNEWLAEVEARRTADGEFWGSIEWTGEDAAHVVNSECAGVTFE